MFEEGTDDSFLSLYQATSFVAVPIPMPLRCAVQGDALSVAGGVEFPKIFVQRAFRCYAASKSNRRLSLSFASEFHSPRRRASCPTVDEKKDSSSPRSRASKLRNNESVSGSKSPSPTVAALYLESATTNQNKIPYKHRDGSRLAGQRESKNPISGCARDAFDRTIGWRLCAPRVP